MAFIYPQLFPSGCEVHTETDPTTIIVDGQQPYLWGFSLEEAMHILWKVCTVRASATYTATDLFGTSTSSATNAALEKFIFPPANTYGVDRMSRIICLENPWTFEGTFVGTSSGAGFFSVVLDEAFPVYFFDDQYYLFIRAGYNDVGFSQASAGPPTTGSLTVDFGGFTRTSTNAKSSQNPSTQVVITCDITITAETFRDPS
jgi:hypothetical protein